MTEMSPAEEIFFAALEMATPAERAAYLDAACAGQPDLRARVEKLLAAHPRVGEFLEPEVVQNVTGTYATDKQAVTSDLPNAVPGVVVAGKYKLLQQIGEGGMGTVWMADQTEPVKRRVAVKLIRVERGSSATILARFEAERQAIALMDHPHIAKLLDAGTTEAGQPYFVMELVKGIPLTEYCDTHKLSIQQRLGLFQQICSAVQHAHQKGIIHRDLKPTNILVESHDDKPVPKVIDFGLAKATSGMQLTEHTLFTGFGSVMGTPLYMAPEQANFNAVDVDTRADIYALGVILYELLTGTTPLTRETVKKAALDEMLKLIREQEAPTPSSRLSSSDSAPSVAANRQTEPARLGRFVKGELDWIVLKALAKERDRRYETANGFARDIERFLNHEPVAAGPPSAAYRFKKFVQRNRGQVFAAGAVLLALLAGLVATSYGFYRADLQRARAETAESNAIENALAALAAAEAEKVAKLDADAKRKEAEAAKVEAQTKEAEANAVVQFFVDTVFAAGRPKGEAGGLGHDVSLRNAVRASTSALATSFKDQPLVEARLRRALGKTLFFLGDYDLAAEQQEQARVLFSRHLGSDHLDTLDSMNGLAHSCENLNRPAEALKLREEVLAGRRRGLPPDHPDTLAAMTNLAISYAAQKRPAEAFKLREEALASLKRVLPPDHPQLFASVVNLAASYQSAGRIPEAVKLLEEVLPVMQAKLPDHQFTRNCMHNLAACYATLNRHAKAIPLYEESLAAHKRVLPPDHPQTFVCMHSLAHCYAQLNRHAEAIKLFEEALAGLKRVLPPDHPNTLQSMYELGSCYDALNRHAEAIKLREEMLPIQKRVLRSDDPTFLGSVVNLARSNRATGRIPEAVKLLEEVLPVMQAKLPDHPFTFNCMHTLAHCYAQLNRHAEAIKLFEEALAGRRRVFPPDHANTLQSMYDLANSYAAQKRHAEALKLREELLTAQRRVAPPDHPDTRGMMSKLANYYATLNRHSEAIKLREELLAVEKRVLPPDHADTLVSMHNLAFSYEALNRHAEALKLYEAVLAGRLRVLPPDHPKTLESMMNLSNSYEALNRHAEALKLREEALAAQKRVLPKDHPHTFGSVVNLARSYQTAGRVPEAVKLLEEALPVMKAKMPDHPYTHNCMVQLANSYTSLNRNTEAVKLYEEALAGRRRVLPPDHANTLQSMFDLALGYAALNRHTEALPLLDEILANPDRPDINPRLFLSAIGQRLQCCQKLGDLAGCRATAEMFEKRNPTTGTNLFNAACCRAATASLQAKAKDPDAARLAKEEADKAMTWLTKAIAAGFKDAAHMRNDTHLDILRDRVDFQKLLADLEAKYPPTKEVAPPPRERK